MSRLKRKTSTNGKHNFNQVHDCNVVHGKSAVALTFDRLPLQRTEIADIRKFITKDMECVCCVYQFSAVKVHTAQFTPIWLNNGMIYCRSIDWSWDGFAIIYRWLNPMKWPIGARIDDLAKNRLPTFGNIKHFTPFDHRIWSKKSKIQWHNEWNGLETQLVYSFSNEMKNHLITIIYFTLLVLSNGRRTKSLHIFCAAVVFCVFSVVFDSCDCWIDKTLVQKKKNDSHWQYITYDIALTQRFAILHDSLRFLMCLCAAQCTRMLAICCDAVFFSNFLFSLPFSHSLPSSLSPCPSIHFLLIIKW